MKGANRPWIIGAVLLMIVSLLGGWFLGIQPQLAEASAADSDRVSLEASNDLAMLELTRLKAQEAALPKLRKELDDVQNSIPSSGLLEEYTAQLSRLASANALTLSNLDFSAAAPFSPGPGFETLIPPSLDTTKLIVIPLTWTVVGSRDDINRFVNAVQNDKRLTLVSQFVLATGPDGAAWAMDATGAIFVLLDEPGVIPVDGTVVPDPNTPIAPTPTATP